MPKDEERPLYHHPLKLIQVIRVRFLLLCRYWYRFTDTDADASALCRGLDGCGRRGPRRQPTLEHRGKTRLGERPPPVSRVSMGAHR